MTDVPKAEYLTHDGRCRLCGDTGVVACSVVPKSQEKTSETLGGFRPCVCGAGISLAVLMEKSPLLADQLDQIALSRSDLLEEGDLRCRKTYILWQSETDENGPTELQLRYVNGSKLLAALSVVFETGQDGTNSFRIEMEGDYLPFFSIFSGVLQKLISNSAKDEKSDSVDRQTIVDIVSGAGFAYEFEGDFDSEEGEDSSWSDAADDTEESAYEDLLSDEHIPEQDESFDDFRADTEMPEQAAGFFVSGTTTRSLTAVEIHAFQQELRQVCDKYGVKI